MGGYATLSGQGGRTGKDTENASASQPGHCCLVGEDRVRTGAQHKKTPSRSPNIRRGCVSTRAAWHYIHTARLRAGRRIHCSAPHCKGYCHTDRPTRKPWGFTLTANLYICLAANFCQAAPHAPVLRGRARGHQQLTNGLHGGGREPHLTATERLSENKI
jgi:hypothetical protein